jgi:hypothetical protein
MSSSASCVLDGDRSSATSRNVFVTYGVRDAVFLWASYSQESSGYPDVVCHVDP